MNRENFEKWMRDLESTDEPQISGALSKAEGGDCCLGRLCKLAIADGVAVETRTHMGFVVYDDEDTMPPDSVRDWIEADAVFYVYAADLNDKHRLSFKEIAAQMRERYDA